MDQKWLEILMKSALFRGFSTEDLLGILDCLKPRVCSYKKNEFITIAGENLTGVGIILSGEVAVTKENAAGNRIVIAVLKPGEMFGETAAFSGSAVWPATVLAQAASTVLFLPPGKIVSGCEKACMSHRRLITNMLKVISNKALMLNRRVEYFLIKSIRGKISTYLLEQYQETGSSTFILPLNRNVLADFLNVSRPSLSREMCRMRDEGIIEFHRSSVCIKDAAAVFLPLGRYWGHAKATIVLGGSAAFAHHRGEGDEGFIGVSRCVCGCGSPYALPAAIFLPPGRNLAELIPV